MEPLLKQLNSSRNTGYYFHNHAELKATILACADDIVLIVSNYKSLINALNILEKYYKHYGVKINNKSAYTYKGKPGIKHPQFKPPTLSGNIIDYITECETYKYLDINMSLDLNWTNHINIISKKYSNTLVTINNTNIDPRLKVRCVNTVSNAIISYSLYTITVKKELLIKLENQAKAIIKNSFRTSKRSSSQKLWAPTSNGGLSHTRLTNLNTKNKPTDFFNVLNFAPKNLLVYLTTTARIQDILNKNNTNISTYKTLAKSKSLTAHSLQLAKSFGFTLFNSPPKSNNLTTLSKLANLRNLNFDTTCIINKLAVSKLSTLEHISHNLSLLTLSDINNKIKSHKISHTEWLLLKEALCDCNLNLSPETIDSGSNFSWFAKRKINLINLLPPNPLPKTYDIYTNGSFFPELKIAGSGLWCHQTHLAFCTYNEQSIYNAELQAVIAALFTPPPDSIINIFTDSQNTIDFISSFRN